MEFTEFNSEKGMNEVWKSDQGEVVETSSRVTGLLARVMREIDGNFIFGPELLSILLRQPEAREGVRKYRECLSSPIIQAGYRPMDIDGFLGLFSGIHHREEWLSLTSGFVNRNGPLRMVS